jgi:serine protease AprX
MKTILSATLLLLVISVYSQQIPQKYFVTFKDKNGTPYTISNPQAFLTQRSIDRRAAHWIPILEEDLPVNPAYVSSVRATGVQVIAASKWFNGIIIRAVDSSILNTIRALPSVQSVLRVTAYTTLKSMISENKFRLEESLNIPGRDRGSLAPVSTEGYDYGPSHGQIHLLNGDLLANMGYRGQGKVIAVLDAGFLNVDINPAFDSLRINHQILGTRDFVTPGADVYREFWHGGSVLSTMGGNTPGQLIGTAPKASYWLIRTEDANTENIIEEYNWVIGAEMADSVGADVINSSLGYAQFDHDYMNHTCADMNGTTNPSTRGANIAYSKGIALSISAGNEGGTPWTCISSPSDALNALSIAAVDSLGSYASFSSTGIVNGSFVKPNIASVGYNAYLASWDNSFGFGFGTSFASPINAGMMACLLQAVPILNPSQLYLAIIRSASQYTHPDSLLGYGIPDYRAALGYAGLAAHSSNSFQAYPNPFIDGFTISFDSRATGNYIISLISITGETVLQTNKLIVSGGGNTLTLHNLAKLANGVYILKISSGTTNDYLHLVKTQN